MTRDVRDPSAMGATWVQLRPQHPDLTASQFYDQVMARHEFPPCPPDESTVKGMVREYIEECRTSDIPLKQAMAAYYDEHGTLQGFEQRQLQEPVAATPAGD